MGPVATRVKTLTKPTAQVALLATALDVLISELRDLKLMQRAVEARGIFYRGVWQAADQYNRGDLATYKGSIWHANESTRNAPGDGRAWSLAVKGVDR